MHAYGTTSTVYIDDEEEVQQLSERNGKAEIYGTPFPAAGVKQAEQN
jgi:hypothetical protein